MAGSIRSTILGAPYLFPRGKDLAVKSVLVPPNPENGVILIDADNLVNGPLLALWCSGNGVGNHRGSAFLVAPGVAITAYHVIQDYKDHEGLLTGDAELVAFGQQGGIGLSWVVRKIVEPEEGDVAILLMDLHTQLPEDFTLLVFELGARLPRLGERGTVLGIRSNLPGGVNEMDDARRDIGKLAASTIASSGPVTDLWPKGRPWLGPAFGLEATSIGCMSGGPVFDARGLAIGMVSLSVKEGDDYTSTASLLWQSLWMEVGPTWPPGFLAKRFRLRDLMRTPEAAYVVCAEQGGGLVYINRPD